MPGPLQSDVNHTTFLIFFFNLSTPLPDPPTVSVPVSVTVTYSGTVTIAANAAPGSNGGTVTSYQWYSTSRGKLVDLDGYSGTQTQSLRITNVK